MPEMDSPPPLVLIASDQEWSGRPGDDYRPARLCVVRAYTGHQVLETVRNTHLDILILDTRLPDIDGITLCRQLRDDRAISATTPIISTTSIRPPAPATWPPSPPAPGTSVRSPWM